MFCCSLPHGVTCSGRHGQSEYNAIGRIGGDSGLSVHGVNYAKKLAEFVDSHVSQRESERASIHVCIHACIHSVVLLYTVLLCDVVYGILICPVSGQIILLDIVLYHAI